MDHPLAITLTALNSLLSTDTAGHLSVVTQTNQFRLQRSPASKRPGEASARNAWLDRLFF